MSPIPNDLNWQSHALFLDFDGTLAPITNVPDAVVMSPAVCAALKQLKVRTDGALAIISGRALADLKRHLAALDCVLSGSHGLEFSGHGMHNEAVVDVTGRLDDAICQLSAFAVRHGLIVENKPGAATLHYRNQPNLAENCHALVNRIAEGAPDLRALHGNMVSEVALSDIDKGTALTRLMAMPPFRGRLPVMAGDDVTDEDAFRAASAMGGFGIKVGTGPTSATHRAADIDTFLGWLCEVAGVPQS